MFRIDISVACYKDNSKNVDIKTIDSN